MQLFNAILIGAAANRRPSGVAALVGNLIPAVCVLLFGWSVFALMILYWVENLIVGLFNLAKMVVEGVALGPKGVVAAIVGGPFFVFHYGMFCAIHGIFVWMIFGGGENVPPLDDVNPIGLFQAAWAYVRADRDLALNALALFGVHLFQFVGDWLWRGQWKGVEPLEQMVRPYGRIAVLHLTILGGAVPVLVLGQPTLAVCLLALLKTAIEVVSAGRPSGGAKPAPALTYPS